MPDSTPVNPSIDPSHKEKIKPTLNVSVLLLRGLNLPGLKLSYFGCIVLFSFGSDIAFFGVS